MLRDVPKERDLPPNTPTPVSETHRAKLKGEQASKRAPGSAYWLIARNKNGRLEVLATGLADVEKALPVFSHEEEAELFLRHWEVGFGGWQVRESSAGELVSVLYGPCAGVERVALDPLPEMLVERTVGFVSLSWERFVDLVLSRTRRLARREV